MDRVLHCVDFSAYFRPPILLSCLISFPQQVAWWAFGFKHSGIGSFQVK